MRRLAVILLLALSTAAPAAAAAKKPATKPKPKVTTTTRKPTTTTVKPKPAEVLRVSGDANSETRDFRTTGPWEVRWVLNGGVGLTIHALDSATDREVAQMAPYTDANHQGASSSFVRKPCTCYLKVESFGTHYDLIVVDNP